MESGNARMENENGENASSGAAWDELGTVDQESSNVITREQKC